MRACVCPNCPAVQRRICRRSLSAVVVSRMRQPWPWVMAPRRHVWRQVGERPLRKGRPVLFRCGGRVERSERSRLNVGNAGVRRFPHRLEASRFLGFSPCISPADSEGAFSGRCHRWRPMAAFAHHAQKRARHRAGAFGEFDVGERPGRIDRVQPPLVLERRLLRIGGGQLRLQPLELRLLRTTEIGGLETRGWRGLGR